MDTTGKPKKARKRTSRNESETSLKKAKINEEVLEREVVRENVDSDRDDTNDVDRQDIFNGQSLRTLFSSSSSTNNLAVLRKFVTVCNENKEMDLAAEYLLTGGSVLEVLKLLDKKNTANATTVFAATHILLMRILTECSQYQNSAIEACRHLLNSHMSVVHSMLSIQSSAKQRKVVLRLLAAIASLDSGLSRELLIHLSLQQQTLESLVQQTKPTDPQSVRTCFIHFVLAFLVEGNTLVIRTLLDKRSLLCCIFSDLLYDSKDTVTLVLTTVKTYVLENIGVSKTMKMHVFSVPAILNLISLYNWKGPNNWSKNKTHSVDDSENFLADKKVISDIVHEFLIILLTSHRHGVIFHDRTLGSSRSKHNQLVHTILQSLEKPWEHEKPSDLIVRIMAACPDLIRSQYNAVEPFLEPRMSPKWISLLKFIEKIVKSVNPVSCIKNCTAELKANNLISALLSLAVPSAIVKVAVLPGLDHDSLLVRHEALSLLLTMTNQLKVISSATKEFYKISTVRSQITDFILRAVPSLETILRLWNRAFENDTDVKASESTDGIQNPELLDHLDTILSVLHSYQDICPELLDVSTNLQPDLLLSSLNNLQEDEGEPIKMEKVNCMKVKTIQFLLALDSSIFVPREKAFKEVLVFLISLIRQKDPSPDSYSAIRTLLNTTGLFEACEDQLDIWINGFSVVADSTENEQLTRWFMSVLKSAIKHIDKYISIITQAEGGINDQIANLNVKKAEDIINELFDETNKITGQEEFSAVGSSLINGQFNLDDRKADTIDDSFKFNQNSKDIKHTKCIAQGNDQAINFDTKEMEDIISQLLDKNLKSFSFNKDYHKILSTLPFLTNKFTDLDKKEMNEGIDALFNNNNNNFSKENSCRMQACTAVSPLLCCALQKISEKDCTTTILAYLSYVMVHTLHYQVAPDLLTFMTTDLTNLPIYKYLQSWSSGKQPISLKNKLPSLRLLHKLSNILLADSKMDVAEFSKLFNNGHSTYCFKYGDEEVTIEHSLSLYDVKILLKMTVFYLAQLAQSKVLRQAQNENCKLVLAFLLNIPQSVESNRENARCIFTHPILLHYFSPFCGEISKDSAEGMITDTILKICESVLHLYGKHDEAGVYNIFFTFRSKYLTQLRNIIERNSLEACSNNYDIAIELLKILQLEAKDIASLLLALMKLEKTIFISNDKQNLSVFGRIVPVLLDMYCSRESRLRDLLNEQFVERFSLHLIHLKSSKTKHTDDWERALARYLSIFPQNVSGVSTNTFALLLTKGIISSTIQLITTLITKNTRLISSLVKYFLRVENMKQGDVVFPILGSSLKHKWNEKFLRSLYEGYGSDITAYVTGPQNPVPWIEENAAAIVYLIESTFDLALCERICDTVSQNGDKLDMVSVCFVQLLESVYKRYESLIAAKEKPSMDLIRVLLHVMTSTLKKESKNIEKIKVLCEKLNDAVVRLKRTDDKFVFSSLSKSYSWPQFTRFSLKLGLKDAKDEETQSSVLKTLSNLCDIAYGDNIDDEYAKTLFEMTTSHSEFVNIMLGSSTVKGDLVDLLRILTRKNHSVMTVSHVPLYLAAYNATLCHVDQRILQILQYYETHNVKLQQYWPYLWGNAAATRYSVKGETDTALWRQPSTSEVFNLFNKDIVNETIKNYPIHRAFKNDELHEDSNVYDPAFYLPLLCTLLAENNIVACHKISQSGALALVFAACCSDSSDIRMIAYTVVSRYYFHLEASKSKEKLLWIRLIDAFRNGVVSLKCGLKNVRLSCLMTTFLARASLVASQPLHPLYSPLHTFLMAKTALDLSTIPELLQLLHSSHVEHNAHRHWILENIRDGMKEESDVNVALKCMLFKILLDFHICALPDAKTKTLILEVIVSTTRIPKASLLLTRGYGMLPWLHEILNHMDICEGEIKTIIIIIENLLNTLDNSTQDINHYKFLLLSFLFLLQMHLKNRT
ncbi:PREDICTED: nucleolar pre-ribosomal-associated protein 1 isoform X1 [Wasmannia auropunctata]|uniref:nucleolar pre-ribosomal-associated protein 1 isoform X1 n=1 Tax=Wasmannia auropunctata TaxID=64793 RepID=UPI0005EF6AB4|nr:PREDICTED: nucleolar pre-ribosomal-associated protein 1 isoform X1 [Wasmannia auropunctata]XP_011695236.1 PREDICTED: nucleolar pre-ribosomal-associated protein 1 isoform X1 [Wasmannia auropunctata]